MPLAPRKSLSSFPLCFPFTQFLPFLTSSSSSSSFFFFFLLLLFLLHVPTLNPSHSIQTPIQCSLYFTNLHSPAFLSVLSSFNDPISLNAALFLCLSFHPILHDFSTPISLIFFFFTLIMSAVLARTGRHRQRYDDHFRLVSGYYSSLFFCCFVAFFFVFFLFCFYLTSLLSLLPFSLLNL